MDSYTIAFCDGWRFAKEGSADYRPVPLPHDWLIDDAHNFYQSGVGTYIRSLVLDDLGAEQRVFLRFDGVYMDCTLFVNEMQAGQWKYGYTAFEFDITGFLRRDGSNEIKLEVNYQSPNSRWYSGAGIFRPVWLKVKNPCYLIADGIVIDTSYEDGRWSYDVSAEVESGGRDYSLRHSLLEADGVSPADRENIQSWDITAPKLYVLRTELMVDGVTVDVELTRFGFRRIQCTTDKGFFLNGRSLKLNGVCLHHDLGGFGGAVEGDAIRRQITLLKDMGVNAIRTAHNPPAALFMDICDEMGVLVVSELLDMWRSPKTKYDYARFFEEWIDRDVASWVRRDRNHPSLILWSVGNEVYDTHANAETGGETLRLLMELTRKHDPAHHAPITFGSNYMPWENTQKCADIIKLVGYNYAEPYYEEHHKAHPDWILYGSETCSTVQSRGVYHFPLSKSILADDDLQCSALGNSSTSWGAKSVEDCISNDRNAPFSLGQFIWAGQDYIGEPTPYHTKNSYFGHIDTAGFPKDSYYSFRAAWLDSKESPTLHLYPYWDFSIDQTIDICVCSNAHRVELSLNDENLGEPMAVNGSTARYVAPYQRGTLRAVAYDENDNVVGEVSRWSFGDAVSHKAVCERYGSHCFYTITALDRDGRPVENANHRVTVSAEKGRLLFLDNGDSTDYEPYRNHSRRLFGGKLLAVVRADGGEDPILHVEADKTDVPIRKIELMVRGQDPYEITARIHPGDATYGELTWRLTDAGGIDSPLGRLDISEDNRSAKLFPLGDGTVYVRCMAANGKEHPALISAMDIHLSGYGKPFLNPYAFVSGGLYTYSNIPVTNGNERGVASARDGRSEIGFDDLDFGSYGSDEITIPLFPLSGAPFDFEIWEGYPDQGGEKLLTARYDKGSRWNTYQEASYKLPRRLRGVTSICLCFTMKVHIKGFVFTRPVRAFETLLAQECEHIYGDNFSLQNGSVEQIGNNVTLDFGELDFDGGTAKIMLRWRSRPEKTSALFVFAGENGEVRHMLELPRAADYKEEVYPLAVPVCGRQRLTLVFLPGSDLDLQWIRFLR